MKPNKFLQNIFPFPKRRIFNVSYTKKLKQNDVINYTNKLYLMLYINNKS